MARAVCLTRRLCMCECVHTPYQLDSNSMCPNCHTYSNRLKFNRLKFTCRRPLTPTAAAVVRCNMTHDSRVHTQSYPTPSASPTTLMMLSRWSHKIEHKVTHGMTCLTSLWGPCWDVTSQMLNSNSCLLQGRHLNTDAPERHSVIVKDWCCTETVQRWQVW